MKQKGIFAGVLAASLLLTACGTNEDNAVEVEEDTTSIPAVVNDAGAIVVENGVVIEPVHNHDSDAVRVDMFMEPLCPACQAVEQEIAETIQDLNEEGDIVLYSTPVSFMDSAAPEGYSSQAVSSMYGVAEHAPEQYLDYVEALYSDEYFPSPENTIEPTPEHFIEVATSVGIDESAADQAVSVDYTQYALEMTEHIDNNRPEINRSPDGVDQPGISTPTITVGGEFTEEGQLDGHTRVVFSGEDLNKEFMEALQPYLDDVE